MAEGSSSHTAGATPGPPTARRIRSERTYHGDTVVDEYAWLADKDDPETIAYLEAENAYTAAITAGQAGLREEIFAEIKGRTKETDLSVPTRKGGWWYYSRTVEGKQYSVHCRRPVRPGETRPTGAAARGDVLWTEERDPRCAVGGGLPRRERYVSSGRTSAGAGGVWLLDAPRPAGSPQVAVPRHQGVEYSVEHQAGPDGDPGRLLILHNDGVLNFELASVPLPATAGPGPLAQPANFTTAVGHRQDTRLLRIAASAGH